MRTAFAALMLAAPAAAQVQTSPGPGQDTNNPRSNTIAAGTAPGVAAANDAANADASAAAAVRADLAQEDQALYRQDVAAYEDARRARRSQIAHDQSYYDRQQRAYAQAMADWRLQAEACRKGSMRACNAPTPRPGDYL